jgi:hypothetical protein
MFGYSEEIDDQVLGAILNVFGLVEDGVDQVLR